MRSARLRLVAAARVLIVSFAALAACGSDPPPTDSPMDAGADAPDVRAVVEPIVVDPPEPPASPAPVRFGCPAGWTSLETPGGASVCEPWPGGEPPACADDELAFPGEPCAPLGPPCPSDGWPADLPDAGVVYVRADEPDGGDGSRARPFARIGQALSASRIGDVVALAVGTYDDGSVLVRDRTLWGACASGTVIRADTPNPSLDSTVAARGTVTVRNVRIEGALFGVYAFPDAEVVLESVWIRDMVSGPYLDTNAHVVARGLVVENVVDSAVQLVGPGSRAEVSRGWLARAGKHAVLIDEQTAGSGASIVLEDVAVVAPRQTALAGLDASGAQITVRRSVLLGASPTALYVVGGETTLEDVVIAHTEPAEADGMIGGAGALFDGGRIAMSRVLVRDDGFGGIAVTSAADLDVDGFVLFGVRGRGAGGEGLAVSADSVGNLRHVHIESSAVRSGLGVSQSHVTVEDLTIVDLRLPESGYGGFGINVIEQAVVTVRRALVEGAQTVAVTSSGSASLVLEDATITDVHPFASPAIGYALQTVDLGRMEVHRARIERAYAAAIYTSASTSLATDVDVLDTLAADGVDAYGIGLGAREDSLLPGPTDVTIDRFRVRGSRRHGVIAYGADVSVVLSNVDIDDISLPPCASSSCADTAGGNGIVCVDAARIDVSRTRTAGAPFAGVLLVTGCEARLDRVLVRDNAFGFVSDATIDLERTLTNVRFEDNDVDFQTTTLTVAPPDEARLLLE